MSFVPIVVQPPRQISPQARELGRRISETIDRYVLEHPGTRAADVQQALSLARPVSQASKMVVVGLLLATLLLALVLTLFLRS